jgi:hypothetical protein
MAYGRHGYNISGITDPSRIQPCFGAGALFELKNHAACFCVRACVWQSLFDFQIW